MNAETQRILFAVLPDDIVREIAEYIGPQKKWALNNFRRCLAAIKSLQDMDSHYAHLEPPICPFRYKIINMNANHALRDYSIVDARDAMIEQFQKTRNIVPLRRCGDDSEYEMNGLDYVFR